MNKTSSEECYTNMCRTCLSEHCSMKSVFSVEDVLESQSTLGEMLMQCASVQIYKGDGLPENVCHTCAQEMNRAFIFRKLCEKSEATLKEWISSVKSDDEKNDQMVAKEDSKEIIGSFDECNNDYNDESDEYKDDDFSARKKVRKKRQGASNSQKRSYACKECGTVCYGLGEYQKHVSATHSQPFKCELCDKVFNSEARLNRHTLSHENELDTEDLDVILKQKHVKNKSGVVKKRNLPRTCNICNKTFRFHSNLERHKLIHTGEKPFLCNVCGKGFAQLSYLKIHSFIHTGEKPYKCKMCEKSFAAPGTLMTHVRTHTGERPHICKICGKDFPQSGYLSAHIRTHTGEKPVECKVCHRRFNQSGRLIIHMRIHSGEKPYTCVECGRSFAVKGTLKKHMRTHTGERPYVCSACGQAFAQSGTLATHMKVHRNK